MSTQHVRPHQRSDTSGEGQHFVLSYPSVEPEPEDIVDRWVVDPRVDPRVPAPQHLGRCRNLAPHLAAELAAAGKLEINRVAQLVMIESRPAVDRAQQ